MAPVGEQEVWTVLTDKEGTVLAVWPSGQFNKALWTAERLRDTTGAEVVPSVITGPKPRIGSTISLSHKKGR